MKYSKFTRMVVTNFIKSTLFSLFILCTSSLYSQKIICGATQIDQYLPLLKNKKVAVVCNQTSVVPNTDNPNTYTHLIDILLSKGIDIQKIFAPEHGFRGEADAGEKIDNGIDPKTGLPIISLYGSHKKPTPQDLTDIDIVVFDIQDVGVRFYTYLSTLHYVMEALAELQTPLVLLDRPNPNADYIDGPIMQDKHHSFVGLHPVPIVYGLTIGEYAMMINGEKWLHNGIQTDLMVIPLQEYNHSMTYSLPIPPSPNLPNDQAIALYPSLALFEGTDVNAGRGTNKQFQIFGAPKLHEKCFTYSFVPKSNKGAKSPKHLSTKCFGRDLSDYKVEKKINLDWLIEAYTHSNNQRFFFNEFFVKLSGTSELEKMIKNKWSAEMIRQSWRSNLSKYKMVQEKYLLYPNS